MSAIERKEASLGHVIRQVGVALNDHQYGHLWKDFVRISRSAADELGRARETFAELRSETEVANEEIERLKTVIDDLHGEYEALRGELDAERALNRSLALLLNIRPTLDTQLAAAAVTTSSHQTTAATKTSAGHQQQDTGSAHGHVTKQKKKSKTGEIAAKHLGGTDNTAVPAHTANVEDSGATQAGLAPPAATATHADHHRQHHRKQQQHPGTGELRAKSKKAKGTKHRPVEPQHTAPSDSLDIDNSTHTTDFARGAMAGASSAGLLGSDAVAMAAESAEYEAAAEVVAREMELLEHGGGDEEEKEEGGASMGQVEIREEFAAETAHLQPTAGEEKEQAYHPEAEETTAKQLGASARGRGKKQGSAWAAKLTVSAAGDAGAAVSGEGTTAGVKRKGEGKTKPGKATKQARLARSAAGKP